MGREASGFCHFRGRTGHVRVFLETTDVIVRGEIRAHFARDAIADVRAEGTMLTFTVANERVSIELGAVEAGRFASALLAPAPSLARKLGITAATRLHVSGPIDDDALAAAVSGALVAENLTRADLAIVRIDSIEALDAFVALANSVESMPPVWIAYVKGRAGIVAEGLVRETMRANGFIDTKVASVSETLTSLRFMRRAS